MNNEKFLERAHANPHDDSTDFLEAITGNPERQTLVESLKTLDSRLKAGLESVSAPDSLKQKLLEIPESSHHSDIGRPDASTPAANDSFWRRNGRNISYAAGLVMAIGVLTIVVQSQSNPLEDLIFQHIYSEISFLEDDSPMGLAQVNEVMKSTIGSNFSDTEDMENISINFTKDCWMDYKNGVRGVHLVMKGDVGPVTVMVIPNTPVARETAINDDHFYGIITPTSGGNIVVVGEKNESLQQYSTLMASNISW